MTDDLDRAEQMSVCPRCVENMTGVSKTIEVKYPKTTWRKSLTVVSDMGYVGMDGRHWLKVRKESWNSYDGQTSVHEVQGPCGAFYDESEPTLGRGDGADRPRGGPTEG